MRAGGSLKDGLRPEPQGVADQDPLPEESAVPGGSYHAGAGTAEPAERSAPRPSSRQEQNAETSRDPS
jgi:hypothetical protein